MDLSIYAPENAASLTPEQLAAMEFFTAEDLNQLAKAYPNKSNQRPYLILKDKSKKNQIWPVMTWENVRNLHRMGQKHFVPVSFKSIFYKGREAVVKTAPMQDLTRDEVLKGLQVKSVSVTPPGTVDIVSDEKGVRLASEDQEDKDFEDLSKEAAAKAVKSTPIQKTTKGSKKK